MGMGLIGHVAVGAARGFGEGMAKVGMMEINSQIDAQRAEAIERMRRAFNKEDAQAVSAAAGQIAAERGVALESGARSAYENSGMSQEDISAGLKAVDEAKAAGGYKQEVSSDDRFAAARELGIIGEKEAIGIEHAKSRDERDERRLDLSDKKAEAQAARDTLRLELQERKLDLDSKKIDAMISKIGGSNANVSAFVQNFDKIKKETGWDSSKVLEYMNSAKAKEEEWSVTEGQDQYGNPTKSVTRKGSGEPPAANNDPLGIRKK